MLKSNILSNKRGQIAIYVIVALVIVGAILVGVYYRGGNVEGVSSEFRPAYSLYISCVEQQTKNAIGIIENQGGHLYPGRLEAPSAYAPFSSELSFLGYSVPYWYYISGNGLVREDVPSVSQMESEIGQYLGENIGNCDFSVLDRDGFDMNLGAANVAVKISDSSVDVQINQDVAISKGEAKAFQNNHKVSVKSGLGMLFNGAKNVYDNEKKNGFLEKYAEDVLRTYAPVDGVEFNCAPKVWRTRDVYNNLQQGLIGNIGAIKLEGNYYKLQDKKDEYFVVKLDEKFGGTSANFVYNSEFPIKMDINGGGVSQETMAAQPVGNQQGLGFLGFCYVPYHFVYDLSFPVMIQLFNGDEMFQFPVVVVIDKNKPREASEGTNNFEGDFDLCSDSSKQVSVKFYDVNLKPVKVNASVSYSCLDQVCNLGSVSGSELSGNIPACVNGQIEVMADGYGEKRQIFSSNSEYNADIILDKEYDVNLNVKLNGKNHTGNAVVIFEGENAASALLPEQKSIKLTEGLYNISVFAYSNTSIVIPASSKTLCNDVPRKGFLGLFGGSEKQCTEISLPETKIESGIIGGGKTQTYLFPADLEKGQITLIGEKLPVPDSLETLQYNFEAFDSASLGVDFR